VVVSKELGLLIRVKVRNVTNMGRRRRRRGGGFGLLILMGTKNLGLRVMGYRLAY